MINILTQNITYLDPASLTAAGVSGAGRSSACFDECISSSWSSPLEGVELLFSVLGQFPVLDLRKTRIVSPEKLKNYWRLMQKVYFSSHRHHWTWFISKTLAFSVCCNVSLCLVFICNHCSSWLTRWRGFFTCNWK